MKETDYALGHAEAEMHRLVTQARLIDPITSRFLVSAGVVKGMRILDVGSGVGDVAFLVADLVGETGQIVGTDLSRQALERAEQRANETRLSHVSFEIGDPSVLDFEKPFDAITGRYVLQFMPNPAHSLKCILRHLKPGGVVVFHELDWDGARSSPTSPTYDQVCKWLSKTIEAAGAKVRLGSHLSSIFEEAGLQSPKLRLEAVIASGKSAIDAVHLVTDLVATQLPNMEKYGIATAAEVNHLTLESRIMSEVGEKGTLIGRSEIGAWAVK